MKNDDSPDDRAAKVVALGANLPSAWGAPAETLAAALGFLEETGVRVIRTAPLVRSPAWPAGSGPDYVNGAALIATALTPLETLAALNAVETRLGRVRGLRFGPRVCDLDLLCWGDAIYPDAWIWRATAEGPDDAPPPKLALPHPRLHRRAFALGPLAAVAPDWRHPILGRSAAELFADQPAADRDALRPL